MLCSSIRLVPHFVGVCVSIHWDRGAHTVTITRLHATSIRESEVLCVVSVWFGIFKLSLYRFRSWEYLQCERYLCRFYGIMLALIDIDPAFCFSKSHSLYRPSPHVYRSSPCEFGTNGVCLDVAVQPCNQPIMFSRVAAHACTFCHRVLCIWIFNQCFNCGSTVLAFTIAISMTRSHG